MSFARHILPSLAEPYICSKCIKRSVIGLRRQRRFISSTHHRNAEPVPVFHSAISTKHDDDLLRKLFDNPKVFREFAVANKPLGNPTGLFQNKLLTSPDGFKTFVERAIRKAQRLVERIANVESYEKHLRVVKDLDRLSDVICQVIDLSAFVRDSHPDRKMVEAANHAYTVMFEYMNILNVTPGLYETLKRTMQNRDIMSQYSDEEKMVAKILMTDFEKSGITLPLSSREKFVTLSNEIAKLGSDFINDVEPETLQITVPSTKLQGMDPVVIKSLSNFNGKTILTALDISMNHALQTVDDPTVRKQAYLANNTSSKRQLDVLDSLMRRRAELARLVGSTDYAEVTLKDKMAQTPEAVNHFLMSLAHAKRPYAQVEYDCLAALKMEHMRRKVPLQPWDYGYYYSKLRQHKKLRAYTSDSLDSYFSLGTVIQGLSRLFSRLYGVRLVPHRTAPGETWNEDVRRLDVISEDEGHIAVVYCDLFKRDGKNPNPCHYTLRCSRLIEDVELEEEASMNESLYLARRINGAVYQLPIIALICDFQSPSSERPPLLEFHEVTTLFHEMGHAIHSILARTTLHNVSGTRCATDFSELPSVLMESFAKSPEVMSLYARHWETDKPLPQAMIKAKLATDTPLKHSEGYTQIVLSLLDQKLHSALALEPDFDSTKIFHDLEKMYNIIPPVAGTSWQGFFTHLFGYGAVYYSYLLDTAIADRVWKDVFAADPLSRDAGERYKAEVLKWGGGRNPWTCVAKVLSKEELQEGGVKAMEEVGKWGALSI